MTQEEQKHFEELQEYNKKYPFFTLLYEDWFYYIAKYDIEHYQTGLTGAYEVGYCTRRSSKKKCLLMGEKCYKTLKGAQNWVERKKKKDAQRNGFEYSYNQYTIIKEIHDVKENH